MKESEYKAAFATLTGYPPFPWQWELYDKWFRQGKFPSACNLPTGLGKTSVVAIWRIALRNHPDTIPRRLVYVVNRRTVVDQTTNEVEKLRENLPKLDTALGSLALSTLRGQFADNREWSADPSRPAVICGTVDMIGSRLLFSGYGVGFKAKPLHAGFLGQDVLLVHDEAHLEPAFQKLIEAIQKEQHERERTEKVTWPQLRVIELTATSRGGGNVFMLSDEDKIEPEIRKRIEAKKAIHLHENKDAKKLADEIAELALEHKDSGRAVIVFVRKVEDVEKIVKKLPKGSFEQLTGTLRGLERDGLVKKPIFQRFLPESNRGKDEPAAEGTVYLVCTSAGEVGVNISADHLVCDLTTFDSMAQRFGRVNRFGERDDTEIHIVYPKEFDAEDDYEVQLKKTYELLKNLEDGSPKALDDLDADTRREAFAPSPTILQTTDILFDAWALTTIREKLPGRPPVEPYLHGVSEWEPPETHVAWREEVGITDDLLKTYKPKDLLEDYPLKPHELLRDNTKRVYERLKKLAAGDETPVWIVSDDDSVQPTTLGKLRATGQDELSYKTVLLPPAAGGLENGMLVASSTTADDIADEWRNEKGEQRRVRVRDDEDAPRAMRLIRDKIDTKPDLEEEADEESTSRRYWYWYELPTGGDSEGSRRNQKCVGWQVHTCDVKNNAERFLKNLPLPEDMKKAIILAARFHDLGKLRVHWQRSIGHEMPPNPKAEDWLAKSGGKMKLPIFRTDYRHEFGSLLDVQSEPEFQNLDDDMKELVLHLIAAHHGRGRPHFPTDEVFDPEARQEDADALAVEVPQRFARLQRKYGRWGLAYLESLLRAADYASSEKPSEFVEETE